MTLKGTVPSALELRDLLEEMAVRELRGPVQGEDEEVPGRIRDRYLVGILAPRQRAEGETLPLFDRPAAPNRRGRRHPRRRLPARRRHGGRRVRSRATSAATTARPSGRPRCPRPSSPRRWACPSASRSTSGPQGHAPLGPLRQGPQRLPDQPQDRDAQAGLETPALRTPHEIPLKAGPVGPLIGDEAFPDAKVKGLIRRRSDHWSVTLFLVNEGIEPPPPNRERTWMFQCELAVEAPDGSPVFHKRFTRIDLTAPTKPTSKRPRCWRWSIAATSSSPWATVRPSHRRKFRFATPEAVGPAGVGIGSVSFADAPRGPPRGAPSRRRRTPISRSTSSSASARVLIHSRSVTAAFIRLRSRDVQVAATRIQCCARAAISLA